MPWSSMLRHIPWNRGHRRDLRKQWWLSRHTPRPPITPYPKTPPPTINSQLQSPQYMTRAKKLIQALMASSRASSGAPSRPTNYRKATNPAPCSPASASTLPSTSPGYWANACAMESSCVAASPTTLPMPLACILIRGARISCLMLRGWERLS